MKFASRNLLAEAGLRRSKGKQAKWRGPTTSGFQDSIVTLAGKVELGDVLLFFYILALIRQYLWPISNNLLAWVLSFSIALSLWGFALSKKDPPSREERLTSSFYLIVALPLFVIYAMRFVFPDYSFDVLNYHILFAEASLRGWPTAPSEFYPNLNPLPDMVTGIYRHLLGYRLGTIVNYLNLLWAATILVKLLRPYFKRTWLIHFGVLLIFLTETMLFEINNYMVDLMALPLLLQATYLVLHVKEPKTIGYSQFATAFLLAMSVALKLTNVVFVLPITLLWLMRLLSVRTKLKPVRLALLLLVLAAPFIPHSIHLFSAGKAVVPYYDTVVPAPLPFKNQMDSRWGPTGLDAVIWPAMLYIKTKRVSEFYVYSGKIPLGFILAFFFLPFKRIDRSIRALSFLMVLGGLTWSVTTGYTRYASYLEVISGILIVYLSYFLFQRLKLKDSFRRTLSFLPWAVLVLLSCSSLYHVSYLEWSLRPTVFTSPRAYLSESRFLFRDYSLKRFLTPEKAMLFDEVEVWVTTATLTSNFGSLLRPDIPVISLPRYLIPGSGDLSLREIHRSPPRRMFTLTHTVNMRNTLDHIGRCGMGVGKVTIVSIPYYSYHTIYDLALIELLPSPVDGPQSVSASPASTNSPLPAAAFHASITSQNPPASLVAGSAQTLYVTIKNVSPVTWPGSAKNWKHKLNLGNHWLDTKGTLLISDDGRTALPFDLKPGKEVELPLRITAPTISGSYILEIDMVQEQVGWFGGMGSNTLRINIKVE